MDHFAMALGDMNDALCAEFETEILKLVSAASTESPVEAVMRVRALSEIAAVLDTDALLTLAADLFDGGPSEIARTA